jgi:uncharacterized protein with von Willebrand factor type A (vWA) domain
MEGAEMGRIADLCGEVAAAADEGPDGLVLPAEAWDRLRLEWSDEDIEDAMAFVRDSLLQSELVEASDSLSARLVDVLGRYAEPGAYARARAGEAPLDLETLSQLARRVARLEDVLELFRDDIPAPDRTGFDTFQRRLMDEGIEDEMQNPGPEEEGH